MSLIKKAVQQAGTTPLLLLYWLSYLTPKRKGLVLVGEWGGQLRGDNAFLLGKSLQKDVTTFEVYFVQSQSSSLDDTIKKFSIKSLFLHLRAEVFIVGSGKRDLLSSTITHKSVLINAWHGLPIKKIHFMVKSDSKFIKVRDWLLPFFDERPDYVIANNEFIQIMRDAFRPRLGVIDMPQPRWGAVKMDCEKDLVLFAPTFRDINLEFFPLTDRELDEVDKLLEGRPYKLLVTLHPACTFEPVWSFKNIMVNGIDIDLNLYTDILSRARLVISDASSVLIEAAHLGISTLTYFPDELDYRKNSRPLIDQVFRTYCDNKIDNFVDIFRESIEHSGVRRSNDLLTDLMLGVDSVKRCVG